MATPASETVLVLGAGASVAEAAWHRPKRTADHPPLDANFFQRVRRHATQSLLARVETHAAGLGQPDLCEASPPVSLEQHLGRLYFELQTHGGDGARAAYYDLLRLYSDELLTTTEWLAGRSGPVRRMIQAELDKPAKVSVITFNHDLLIENAISQISSHRYGNVWCMRHVYGFGELETCANSSPTFDYDCPGKQHEHIPIYKAHGSVNWVFRTLREHPPEEIRKRRKLLIWTNRVIPPKIRVIRSEEGRRQRWYLWSLIIPPIYEKQGYIRNEMKDVWDGATEALTRADRVIFWGYSFPRADIHARYFFQGAAQANPALKSPILINPDPAAHGELWSVLQPRTVRHYRDVRAYLSAEAA